MTQGLLTEPIDAPIELVFTSDIILSFVKYFSGIARTLMIRNIQNGNFYTSLIHFIT